MVAVAAGWIFWLASASVEAATTGTTGVSYSASASGRQLKWLSQETPKTEGVVQAAAMEAIGRRGGPRTIRRAITDAFADPFNDARAGSSAPTAAPVVQPDSSSSEKSGVMPPLEGDAPQLAPERAKPAESVPSLIPPARGPTIEKQLELAAAPKGEECPDPDKVLEPLTKKDILESVTPKPGDFPQWCKMGKDSFVPRAWAPTTFHWTASALCHKPAYFQDIQLERYGHSLGPWLQPFASGGHFFLSIPALPYAMGLFPPNECIYTLGYYRPGSCAPYMLDALPLSVRAVLFQGGASAGAAFLIP